LKPVVKIMKKLRLAEDNLDLRLSPKTRSYIEGWRDALKWVLGEEEKKGKEVKKKNEANCFRRRRSI